MLEYQINATNFLLKYPNNWTSYTKDILTGNVICSLVKLGIAKINKHSQFRLKSAVKANEFINVKK